MGQNPSSTLDSTLDTVHYEFRKHTKVFSEINNLDYTDFLKCILELNELSRKCVDSGQHQLVFALKKGTDTTFLWKATVRIACVKVRLRPRKIEQFRLLNLKQFLSVFRTFETHITALIRSEDHGRHTTSILMETVDAIANGKGSPVPSGSTEDSPNIAPDECIICMERRPDVLLSCAHSFCCPCIEQWKVQHSACPVCQQTIDDDWVLSETPNADEINEQICAELIKLSAESQTTTPTTPNNP